MTVHYLRNCSRLLLYGLCSPFMLWWVIPLVTYFSFLSLQFIAVFCPSSIFVSKLSDTVSFYSNFMPSFLISSNTWYSHLVIWRPLLRFLHDFFYVIFSTKLFFPILLICPNHLSLCAFIACTISSPMISLLLLVLLLLWGSQFLLTCHSGWLLYSVFSPLSLSLFSQ